MNSRSMRGIAVVDVGYTNTKAILFGPDLIKLAERKMPSVHRRGQRYGEIDMEPVFAFLSKALPELDAIAPVDAIVTSAHGACIATIKADGTLAVPLMDYMSEPPPDVLTDYTQLCPSYAETFSPQLPVALLHAMQLFWQQRVLPQDFQQGTAILPLMQYVAHRLGGKPVTEISAMGCQSHLMDLNTLKPSALAISQGWAVKFAPRVNAWDVIGRLDARFRVTRFMGRGDILAGIHDSNANYLRYLAGGIGEFTLLSTGTWVIGFDTKADVRMLDPARDIVANVDCLGRVVASCRFFGGKEFEIVAGGADGSKASLPSVDRLIARDVMALPNFTDSGGPMPGSEGRIVGDVTNEEDRASLASLYCALMIHESLSAIHSTGVIIVDGPFAENDVFLHCLAGLRPQQKVRASLLRDGTAAGAACLALMTGPQLPAIDIAMRDIEPATFDLLGHYAKWRQRALASL